MGSLSNYAEQAVIKHLTREAAYTPPATVYLALCTADPGEAATGASMSEVANSGGYARTAITFGAAASRRVTQSGTVTFPTASGSWSYSSWALVDSATYGAGNVLAYGSFSASKSVVSGNTPSVASGEIWVEITASTGLSNYAANGFLDRMFRNQAFTVSANYAGLATAVLSDSTTGGTVTEVSGGSYARVAINPPAGGSPAWAAASGGAASNADTVSFAAATGSWGTVVAMFVADASSAGNILWYDNSLTDQAVTSGDTCSWAAGALALSQA